VNVAELVGAALLSLRWCSFSLSKVEVMIFIVVLISESSEASREADGGAASQRANSRRLAQDKS
jgi:hypothetical protein